jgi:hypothetical protein
MNVRTGQIKYYEAEYTFQRLILVEGEVLTVQKGDTKVTWVAPYTDDFTLQVPFVEEGRLELRDSNLNQINPVPREPDLQELQERIHRSMEQVILNQMNMGESRMRLEGTSANLTMTGIRQAILSSIPD